MSAVTVQLNRWEQSFVRGFCQSPEPLCLWLHLPSSLPLHPPQKPWNYPLPPVCHWDHEELPPSSSCLSTLTEHAFLEGSLLFIPSGGLTVNLLHWGKFLGMGPISVGIPNQPLILGSSLYISVSLLLSIYLDNDPAPHVTPFPSLPFQSCPLLGKNNWPGFNLLSFPATANWKTPLEVPPYCQKNPLLPVLPPLFPFFSMPFLQDEETVSGPSDQLIWAICALDFSLSAPCCTSVCGWRSSLQWVNWHKQQLCHVMMHKIRTLYRPPTLSNSLLPCKLQR